MERCCAMRRARHKVELCWLGVAIRPRFERHGSSESSLRAGAELRTARVLVLKLLVRVCRVGVTVNARVTPTLECT
eukprot:2166136-Rhodomonas_salina.2